MFRNMKPSTACDYLKACTVASGAIAASLRMLVIIGWYAIDIRLLEVIPSIAPMQINTAIAFVLSGIALLATARGMAGVTVVCGGIAGSLGLLTLIEEFSSQYAILKNDISRRVIVVSGKISRSLRQR